MNPVVSVIFPYNSEKRHLLGINKVEINDSNELFSCGRDGTVKKWDISKSPKLVGNNFAHSDWVSDFCFMDDYNEFLTTSYDKTVKLYDSDKFEILGQSVFHTDHVKCVAPMGPDNFCTGSFDNHVSFATVKSNKNLYLNGRSNTGSSVYCLSSIESKNQVIAGCLDNKIYIFDFELTRNIKVFSGHKDCVKCLTSIKEDQFCFASGASDKTMKFWDIRAPRAVKSFSFPDGDSIWSISASNTGGKIEILVGCRDGCVYSVDMKNQKYSQVLEANSKVPILTHKRIKDHFWCGSHDSNLRKYKIEVTEDEKVKIVDTPIYYSPVKSTSASFEEMIKDHEKNKEEEEVKNKNQFVSEIKGGSGIKEYRVLNNKRQILTEDGERRILLWDITEGKVIEDFGMDKTLEELEKELFQIVALPNWFKVETKLGRLEIILKHDSTFKANMYPYEAGFVDSTDDIRINLGRNLLMVLFERQFYSERLKCEKAVTTRRMRFRTEKLEICKGIIDRILKKIKNINEKSKILSEKLQKTCQKRNKEFIEKLNKVDYDRLRKVLEISNGVMREKLKFLSKVKIEEYSQLMEYIDFEEDYEEEIHGGDLRETYKKLEKYHECDESETKDVSKALIDAVVSLKILKERVVEFEKNFRQEYDKELEIIEKKKKKIEKEEKKQEDKEGDEKENKEDIEKKVEKPVELFSSDEMEDVAQFQLTRYEKMYFKGLHKHELYVSDWVYPESVEVVVKNHQNPEKGKIGTVGMPFWVLNALTTGVKQDTHKISFYLVPFEKDKSLPELSVTSSKMTAKTSVRVRSILVFLLEKMQNVKKMKLPDNAEYNEYKKLYEQEKNIKDEQDSFEKDEREGALVNKYARLKNLRKRNVEGIEEQIMRKERKNNGPDRKIKAEKFLELISPTGVVLNPLSSISTVYHMYRDRKERLMTFKYRKHKILRFASKKK